VSDRPNPPEEFPPSTAVAVPDTKWTIGNSGRRCRFPVGPGNTSCKAPAVAALNRGRWSRRVGRIVDSWWSYCGSHLYGRWIEDGQVMHWIRRREEDTAEAAEDAVLLAGAEARMARDTGERYSLDSVIEEFGGSVGGEG